MINNSFNQSCEEKDNTSDSDFISLEEKESCHFLDKDQYSPIFWSSFYQNNLYKNISELSFKDLYDNKILSNNFTPELGQKFHFLGIGGIGMSSIVQALHSYGSYVQGSDIYPNRGMCNLLKEQYSLSIEQDQEQIPHNDPFWEKIFRDMNYLVVTSSVCLNHPALLYCHKNQIPVLHRSTVLNEILKPYHVIGITGSHGKTTTTALLGFLLDKLGLDPLIVCGGFMYNYQNNIRLGSGPYAVVEIDEHDDSYINYTKFDAFALLSMTEEHNSLERLSEKFQSMMAIVTNSDFCFFNDDCVNIKKFFPHADAKNCFGYNSNCHNQILRDKENAIMCLFNKDNDSKSYLKFPFCLSSYPNGYHMAASLLIIQKFINCDSANLSKILSFEASSAEMIDFKGVDRRLTLRSVIHDVPFFDDYANHPFTIEGMINSLKENFNGKIWVLFEAHRYSRLSKNFDRFVEIFSNKINLLILPIYSANEKNIYSVSREKLLEEIQKKTKDQSFYLANVKTPEEVGQILIKHMKKGDAVVCFSSGSGTYFFKEVIHFLESHSYFS